MKYPKGWSDQDEQEFRQWVASKGIDDPDGLYPVFDYRELFQQQRNGPDFRPEPKKKRPGDDILQQLADAVNYDRKGKKMTLLKKGNFEFNLRRGSPFGLFGDLGF